MNSILADIRYAIRTLRKQPLFSLVAVLTLAIGIGATTTLFTVVDAILLKPLPAKDPESLVAVYTTSRESPFSSTSFPDWQDLRSRTRTLDDLGGYTRLLANVSVDGVGEMTLGEMVTDNLFDLLGVEMALGREFLPEENTLSNQGRVAVLGHAYWERVFDADEDVVGRLIRINGKPYTIIGVASADWTGMTPGVANTIWVPAGRAVELDAAGLIETTPSPTGETTIGRRGDRWMMLVGRLREGVDVATAGAELDVIMASLAAEYPETNEDRSARVLAGADVRLHPEIDGVTSAASVFLFFILGLLLVVACANIAGILLARATGRRQEIAIRLAVGADRPRIIRQLLTESVVLSAAGGIAGTMLAWWVIWLISAFQPAQFGFRSQFDFSLDPSAVLFAIVVTGLSGLLFGLAPALQASSRDLVSFLKEGPSESRSTGGGARTRSILVAGQIAVSTVLLVGGGLMSRSLDAATRVDLGFDADRIALLTTSFSMHGYEREGIEPMLERMREEVLRLPEVEVASFTARAPLAINLWGNDLVVEGHQRSVSDDPYLTDVTFIDEDYFRVLGTPMMQGRAITRDDDADSPNVVVVNAAFAERYWPGQDPIGRWVARNTIDGPRYEVMGVCADYKVRSVVEAPRPMVHYSRYQRFNPAGTLLVRTRGPAAPALAAIQGRLRPLDPDLTFFESGTLLGSTEITLTPLHVGSVLLSVAGLLTVLLAAVGLYGVIAYSVARRRREFGIRIALGAHRADVVWGVVAQSLPVTLAGLGVGLALAFAASGAISSVLFGVGTADPASYLGALLVLLFVTSAANLVPTLRAVRTDPMRTLRGL